MQSCHAFLLCLVGAGAVQENPLGKVISLMDALTAKVQAEGEAEAKAYKAFVEWCDDVSTNNNNDIKTSTSSKAKLEATIGKAADDAAAAGSKIEDLAASIATDEADLKAATAIRKNEASEFATNQAELVEAVDTLGRAISILGREMSKNPAAFSQVDSSNVDNLVKALNVVVDAASFASADRQKLVALVQSQQNSATDDDDMGAPAASAYKSHSTNIVEVLEDLKEKSEEQLSALRKSESTTKHNFEMLKQSLEDQIAADTKDMNQEKTSKSAAEGLKADSESELAQTVKDLADAKSALASANSDCMRTAADHEATVASRTEELAAIAKAKEILSSSTGGAVEQTYSMLQFGSNLQTRADLANAQIVVLVKKLAQEHHSSALAQLASRITSILRYGTASGSDPFVKVRGLITDLINKLESEAGADATEKAYCDEQMAKTEAKKNELEDDIASLTAKLDQAAAKSARLRTNVKETQKTLAALAKSQAEMDMVRSESHADYVKAKSELEAGLAGVRKALGVLRDYYGSAAAASMFVQQPVVPVHAKASGAGNGIVGILEVVESDFANNLAREETQEADAAADYDSTSQSNAVTKTLKEQDVKYMTQEVKGLDKEISDLSSDKTTENTELTAVLEYYSKIKDRCIAKPETYEQRAERRAAEIAGLKQALSILENETALVQRKKRGLNGGFFLSHQ